MWMRMWVCECVLGYCRYLFFDLVLAGNCDFTFHWNRPYRKLQDTEIDFRAAQKRSEKVNVRRNYTPNVSRSKRSRYNCTKCMLGWVSVGVVSSNRSNRFQCPTFQGACWAVKNVCRFGLTALSYIFSLFFLISIKHLDPFGNFNM